MVVPGGAGVDIAFKRVPRMRRVGIVVIMAPLSSTAVGSSGPVGRLWCGFGADLVGSGGAAFFC